MHGFLLFFLTAAPTGQKHFLDTFSHYRIKLSKAERGRWKFDHTKHLLISILEKYLFYYIVGVTERTVRNIQKCIEVGGQSCGIVLMSVSGKHTSVLIPIFLASLED